MLPWWETGLSAGLPREQCWRFVTSAVLLQNTGNGSPGEILGVAQSPVGKMALLKVCVPWGQGVGGVGEDIVSCYGIPAVGRTVDFFLFKQA